jgi:hypothetical protein
MGRRLSRRSKKGVLAGVSYNGAPRWTTYPFITNPVRWGRMAAKSSSPYEDYTKKKNEIIDSNIIMLYKNIKGLILQNFY